MTHDGRRAAEHLAAGLGRRRLVYVPSETDDVLWGYVPSVHATAVARVPYGIVSSRHGKGALTLTRDGAAPAGITLGEVMPPVVTDGRATGQPTAYGNVSVFAELHGDKVKMGAGRRRSALRQQREEVADLAQVAELVGVEDVVHPYDPVAVDVERDDA